MKILGSVVAAFILLLATQGCYSQNTSSQKKSTMDSTNKKNPVYSNTDTNKVVLSDDEWKKLLPSDVYYVARQKGTERPNTSEYEKSNEIGTYYCAVCGNALFKSDTKFESGCGWPSFDQEIPGAVKRIPDPDGSRIEIQCNTCGAHLGHVFLGEHMTPKDTRHCVNSLSIKFVPKNPREKSVT